MTYLFEKKGKTLIVDILIGWICVVLILFFAVTLYAQVEPFSVSSPPNPVGSGARAMGMGGAFVAVADDATAASWNPAGLIQLQSPEVSAVFSLERRTEKRYFLLFPELDSEGKDTISDLNYLSMVYPFNLARRNWVFSLNYQRLYDFYRELRFSLQESTVEFNSKGTLYTLSPALAIQTTEKLFLGLTLNIWSDKWTGRSGWKNTYSHITPDYPKQVITEEYKDFRGVNANFGLLYRITPQWTLGAVFKAPFRGRFDYIYYNNAAPPGHDSGPYYGKIESLDLPPTYALGISYRVSDALTMSADVTRKDWNELVWHNNKGESYGLFTRFDIDANAVSHTIYPIEFPNIDPTYSFRFGIEYLKILEKTVIPFRGGIFYDPIPSINSPHSEYGIAVGSGISIGHLIMDLAYQYRARSNVPGTETGLGSGVFEDKKQHIFVFSTIYHF